MLLPYHVVSESLIPIFESYYDRCSHFQCPRKGVIQSFPSIRDAVITVSVATAALSPVVFVVVSVTQLENILLSFRLFGRRNDGTLFQTNGVERCPKAVDTVARTSVP